MPLVGKDWSQTGVAHLFSAIKVSILCRINQISVFDDIGFEKEMGWTTTSSFYVFIVECLFDQKQ